jgi:hypothetical protein
MQDKMNKPIFVVGSPRSGTSILSWCLGQHPNILVLEESGWMADLAIDLAIHYQIGTARGDRSTLSAMDIQREEFFATFGKSINDLLLSHRKDLKRKQRCAARAARAAGNAVPENFMAAQSKFNPKARWVDATPEYSFYICGLRKLFPEAVFIHIFRDVTSVVRSMLNFHRIGGASLVANEQEAYNYWLRTVSSCLLAEQAYGPRVVLRVRYSELIDTPELTMRSLLDFLGEPFAAECLTPLQERINSSAGPAGFKIGDPQTDPKLIEQATRLYTQVEQTPQPRETSQIAAQEIEAAFAKRVQYMADLDRKHERARQEITSYVAELQRLHARIAEVTNRLRDQLWNTRKLSHLLDEVEDAAARLRSSRRWKLANPVTAIKAKLFPDKVSLGYGHLEKIVKAYSQWRASHPEVANIDDKIKWV